VYEDVTVGGYGDIGVVVIKSPIRAVRVFAKMAEYEAFHSEM
jgi:hypothetical protein